MSSTENLPDGWIRKESRSRPNNFYYFNIKTGKSQWNPPDDKSKENKTSRNKHTQRKTVKHDEKDRSHSSETQSRHKISDKSKELKKRKLTAPAQDRLQKLIDKNKSAVIDSLKEVKSINLTKSKKSTNNAAVVKTSHTTATATATAKRSRDEVDSAKSRTNQIVNCANSDEIPALFPPKTLAQDRLKSLQLNLSVNGCHSEHDAKRVFNEGFGIESDYPATMCDNTDEAMDWEPCPDSNYTFQHLESMAADVLTDSAYIIPDTNVFLDSMASIKSVIEKETKYNMLIPFVVLQELDQLKRRNDKEMVSQKASRAIQYIYEQLKTKNPRLQGQKAVEDKSHVLEVNSPDDKILNCCVQLKNQSMDIILVTNDKNLSNKALLNGIEAITSKQCLDRF